jgi:hypothetical protein
LAVSLLLAALARVALTAPPAPRASATALVVLPRLMLP